MCDGAFELEAQPTRFPRLWSQFLVAEVSCFAHRRFTKVLEIRHEDGRPALARIASLLVFVSEADQWSDAPLNAFLAFLAPAHGVQSQRADGHEKYKQKQELNNVCKGHRTVASPLGT
jgi:hypothetical protein